MTDYSGQYFIKTEQDGGFSKIYRADRGVMSGVYEAHLIDPTSFEPLGPKLIRRSALEEIPSLTQVGRMNFITLLFNLISD